MFSVDSFFAPEIPKYCHRSLKWVRHCLNLSMSFRLYFKKFPSRLLVKVCFKDFRIFLRLYSRLMIFSSQKPHKSYHWSLKEIWHQPKLLILFKIHVTVFDKIVSSVIFVTFAIIFQAIFSFDNFFTSKTPKNCYRFLK